MNESHKGKLIPEGAEVDEHQFYLQGVGFHLAHALTWMKQLESAVELLTNYEYSKRMSTSRADGSGPHCLDSLIGKLSSEPVGYRKHQAASANG
jgi:hypothetical protein